MVMGIDPRQLAAIQGVSKHIRGIITVNYKAKEVELLLKTDDAEAAKLISSLLSQFANALAQQLSSFFAITGEIVEVGKPGAEEA